MAMWDGAAYTTFSHDDNGNRTGKPQQTYGYTADDRVSTISVTNQPTVSMVYDCTGQKVAQVKGTSVTRYYNPLLDVEPDGKLVKHYFAGGMRIASQRVTPPAGVASLEHPAVMFAQVPAGNRALIVLVRDDLTRGFLLAIGIIGVGLLVAPWHRKPIVGIAVRHGHIIGVIIVFSLSTFPLPILVEPASAQTIPTATLYHYHLDHLGSTQAVTSSSGGVLEYIRYKAYGEIRGHYTSGGGSTSTFYRYEFTGYETEWTSTLEYAGARWYDPTLGMFLTHDPVRQFASPYTYTNWNPTNDTDPNGECIWDLCIVEGILIGAAIGAAVGGGTGAGLGVVGGVVASFESPGLSLAYNLALVGSGAYSTVQSFQSGQYFIGAVGAVGLALGLMGLYDSVNALGAYGPPAQSPGGGGAQFQERGLNATEVGELDTHFGSRDPQGLWQQVKVNNKTGLFGREFTFGKTIFAGGRFQAAYQPGTEGFAFLVHESAHVLDFVEGFIGTGIGGLWDQTKYYSGVSNPYNPSIAGATSFSSFSVEGRATLYEWAYRFKYPNLMGAAASYSNFPRTVAQQQRLLQLLPP